MKQDLYYEYSSFKNHYHEEMRDRAAKGLRHMNYVDWKDQKALLAIYFEMKQKEISEAK
jgi:uncharacterized protein YeaO (DUF488 family)